MLKRVSSQHIFCTQKDRKKSPARPPAPPDLRPAGQQNIQEDQPRPVVGSDQSASSSSSTQHQDDAVADCCRRYRRLLGLLLLLLAATIVALAVAVAAGPRVSTAAEATETTQAAKTSEVDEGRATEEECSDCYSVQTTDWTELLLVDKDYD